MIQAKKRASLMKRRVIASVIGLLAVVVLLIALVVVRNMVNITPWDDVDGTRYYIREKGGVYGLYDENKVELTKESVYQYYVTKSGTLVQINAETGVLGEIITVDNIFTAEGNEKENIRSHRVMMFPHLEKKDILTIEVHNEHGSFTFQRFNTVTNKIDKTADFVLRDSVTSAYDPEVFAELYVDAGYTLTTMKLKNPLKDANGNFSEYGLVPEERTRPLKDKNGKELTDENGEVLTETYRYEPAYFVITDLNGNRHKVIVGDALLTGQGYYVQYVDMSGKEEVKRDAVYVLGNTLQKSVLSRVEDFLQPMITYPLGMMTYTDVQNFVIHKENKPTISFSFIDFTERENTIKAAYPYEFVDIKDSSFMDEIKSMKGYTPHTNNINAALRNLYSPEFVNIIKLNPSNEDMVKYGLYELVVDAEGNPILDQEGNKQYSPSAKYTLSFDYSVEDGTDADVFYTHNHMLLISNQCLDENGEYVESDNYFVYSIIKTTGYRRQKDGEPKRIDEGITYSYNTITEVAGHTLDFMNWDTMKWVSQSIFQDNIAFIDQIDIQSPGYSASFKLDNTEQPKYFPLQQSGVSSNYLKVRAKDSKGRNLTTFNFVEATDKEGYRWLVTASDIQVQTKDGKKAVITEGSSHYEYDAMGNQVLVMGSGGKIAGLKVWVHANEVVAGNDTHVRYSTTLFRFFYQTLFYTEIANTYEVTSAEEKELTDESNLILKMRIKTKDKNGDENTNVYAFYRISARKAYITINGNGGFYVQRGRVEKILSDVEKFFTAQPIDPLAKS